MNWIIGNDLVNTDYNNLGYEYKMINFNAMGGGLVYEIYNPFIITGIQVPPMIDVTGIATGLAGGAAKTVIPWKAKIRRSG